MEAVVIGATILGGIGQMQAANAQASMYRNQAKQAEMQARAQMLQTRAETLNHKRQGVEVLKKVASNLAAINARAAAGSVDPFSGSVQNLAMFNLGKGVQDFYTTRENQQMSQAQGQIIEAAGAIQSAQYIGAANQAKMQGRIAMLTSIASAGTSAQQFGMFKPDFQFTNPFASFSSPPPFNPPSVT